MAIADEKKVKTPSLKKLCSFFQVCLFLYYPLILSIRESCSVDPSILLAPMISGSPTDFFVSALFSVIISRLHLPFFALCFLQVIMSRREFWFPPLNSKKKRKIRSTLWIYLFMSLASSFFLSLMLSTNSFSHLCSGTSVSW